MSSKKVLITGGNGYLGAKISSFLSKKGHLVTAHCFPNIPKDDQWIQQMDKIVVGDLREEHIVNTICNDNFDVAIHLVSLGQYQSNAPPGFVASVNVIPTWNLLENFSKKGSLKQFIYFSTFQVYGEVPNIEISEEFVPCPKNIYGLTHLLSENICNYYNLHTSIDCINVRLSNSYGSPVLKENDCWKLVINDLCSTAFTEHEIKLLSDGSPKRDFIHNSDVCNAIELLSINHEKKHPHNIYNLASGETYSILDLAHAVKAVYQQKYQEQIDVTLSDGSVSQNSNQFFKSERFVINNDMFKSIGFIPMMDIHNGIKEVFEYLERNHEPKQ